ncbi:MAG: formylglycine-generating enzyme family protein [Candidatus Latescibacterota bacterium]|jgi:formylglycine-generating enzyme required for sulfatase activity
MQQRSGLALLVLLCLGWHPASESQEIELDLADGVKMAFIWVEPGTFIMGTTEAQVNAYKKRDSWPNWLNGELPAHQVTLTKGYYLGKYEVTKGQWTAVAGTRPWTGQPYIIEDPTSPAVYVSALDVQDFLHRLNQAAGDSVYRLPTEAEWEYACRAGTDSYWSVSESTDFAAEFNGQLAACAWYGISNMLWRAEPYAHPVGTKLPNPWGFYDMHGNVEEWCADRYSKYAATDQIDPLYTDGGGIVFRGGAWDFPPIFIRSAFRRSAYDDARASGLGFRLARSGQAPSSAVIPSTWGTAKAGKAAEKSHGWR